MADFLATLELWLADPWIGGAVGVLLGATVGSFLATVLIRWPQEKSALGGRSSCDGCGATLRASELVPIVSFLIARGRCRACGARIDPRHLGMELAAAMVGGVALAAHGGPLGGITALFGWWLLLVIALDAEHHWLPDLLTSPLIPLGLLVAWPGFGPPLIDRAIGALAGGLGLWAIAALYRAARGRDGMGGGDPKLLAGLGAWLGWASLPFVLLSAGVLGLIAALVMHMRGRTVEATTRLPLGALMALAAWPLWLATAGAH